MSITTTTETKTNTDHGTRHHGLTEDQIIHDARLTAERLTTEITTLESRVRGLHGSRVIVAARLVDALPHRFLRAGKPNGSALGEALGIKGRRDITVLTRGVAEIMRRGLSPYGKPEGELLDAACAGLEAAREQSRKSRAKAAAGDSKAAGAGSADSPEARDAADREEAEAQAASPYAALRVKLKGVRAAIDADISEFSEGERAVILEELEAMALKVVESMEG